MSETPTTYYATGRRKTSIARVWLLPGESGIEINERPLDEYVEREDLRVMVRLPLETANALNRFKVKATVSGGGISGQAGALKLGIARALVLFDESLRQTLRRSALLTRDPRAKERKKFGRKGARKRFQYTKR